MRPIAACGIAGGILAVGVQIGRVLQRRSGSKSAETPAEAAPAATREAGPAVATRGLGPPAAARELETKEAIETARIDGKDIAALIREEVKLAAAGLLEDHSVKPGLAVILVGERKDSQTYVKAKKKAAADVNFHSIDVTLPEDVQQADLLSEVHKLNADSAVHAILVQLPLPPHLDEAAVLKAIEVEKDADGFAAENIGNLCMKGGDPPLAIPCTPAGCIELLQRSAVVVRGKYAVVIGRSNIVGMPVAALLQSMDATVTVCHSRTQNMKEHVRRADIVVAAIGKPGFVRGDWLKPGCVVIDVGINAIDDPSKKSGHRLVGDVAFAEAQGVASMITPVPGGVGPMTIAMLLKNTLNLARHSLGLPRIPLRQGFVEVAKPASNSLAAGQNHSPLEAAKSASDSLAAGQDHRPLEAAKSASDSLVAGQDHSPLEAAKSASDSMAAGQDHSPVEAAKSASDSLAAGQDHSPVEAAKSASDSLAAGQDHSPVEAAKSASNSLAAGQDYAVVISKDTKSDVWSSAVQASKLRDRVQALASCESPPPVVLEAAPGTAAQPVSLVAYDASGARSRVVCSGASSDEAAVSLGGD